MADYVTLLGAEEVSRAARSMASSAEQMQRAASAFDSAVDRLCLKLDEVVCRAEAAVEQLKENKHG